MNDSAHFIIAVDVGGTKTAAALISAAGKIMSRKQEATLLGGPPQGIVQIERLARVVAEEAGLRSTDATCLGVSLPAVLEAETDRVVWAPKLPGWRDIDLRGALQAALDLPVFVEYDGHAAVLGEWWQGSGRGYHSVVMLIIGTGIGGGMVLDGRLYRGFDRLAGAVGWFALTTDAEQQSQEARSIGFWDALASGPGLARQAWLFREAYPESSLWKGGDPEELTTVEIFAAARRGDPAADQLLELWAGWLGLGIANIVSLVNPQVVILGGGLGSQCQEYLPRIRQVVERWSQPFAARSVALTISLLGADAGLFGAAYSAFRRWQDSQDSRGERNG